MASLEDPTSKAKRPCTCTVTLYPLKIGDNLRERYNEDTADVFFVQTQTNERLPAHRQVLSVASAVFFKMFSGDWKEKSEMKVPAPVDFKWESFKATLSLLYGEEVEVEESFIPDIYGVAHFYDLREVISVLVREIHQWDCHLLDTVVELCLLAEGRPERKNCVLDATIQYFARHLEQVKPLHIARLSYETVMRLVQSEDITVTELAVYRILDQWINAHSDITVKQMRQLLSHIRFGTIPPESLAECAAIGHEYLRLAFENHQFLPVDNVISNMVQVTPRLGQKEVFQVYPYEEGIRLDWQHGQIEAECLDSEQSVGIIYCGKQDIKFELELTVETTIFVCHLFSLHDPTVTQQAERAVSTNSTINRHASGTLKFQYCTVVLNQSGAHLVLKSTNLTSNDGTLCATMDMDLPFTGCFPWVLTFGVRGLTLPNVTIYPPTL